MHRLRAVLKGGKERKGLAAPTETNAQEDALCFMVKTWARRKTTETVLNNGWRLRAAGGWWRLAVGGGWQLVVGGGWQLVTVSGCWSLGAIFKGCA